MPSCSIRAAHLFHQGCPPIRALLSDAGREALAAAELSAAGRQLDGTMAVDVAQALR
jgi:hypothetical protein